MLGTADSYTSKYWQFFDCLDALCDENLANIRRHSFAREFAAPFPQLAHRDTSCNFGSKVGPGNRPRRAGGRPAQPPPTIFRVDKNFASCWGSLAKEGTRILVKVIVEALYAFLYHGTLSFAFPCWRSKREHNLAPATFLGFLTRVEKTLDSSTQLVQLLFFSLISNCWFLSMLSENLCV